ncbi:hypothetical protein ACK1HZ_004793, partial [Salmonella enterica]
PAQDAAGAVTATLTYVDTSGQLLSKAARTGTTSVSIGSVVKKSVDTRFYPQVHVCLTNLDSNGYVTPGTTEVHICDGSGHTIPSGSGYKVTHNGLTTAGCPADGGGVCPSDTAGVKADFTNLTGDDIATLAGTLGLFHIHDVYSGQDMTSAFTNGDIAFYAELSSHKGPANLGASKDLFHTTEANAFCSRVVYHRPTGSYDAQVAGKAAAAVQAGEPTGGSIPADPAVKGLYMGDIAKTIRTGGDTNPEIFVTGIGVGGCGVNCDNDITREYYKDGIQAYSGTIIPGALVFVNGGRSAANRWTYLEDYVDKRPDLATGDYMEYSIGYRLHTATGWNLSDAYFVNNWPGTPYTSHKGNGDSAYHYVTQVNYITGYICAASLH